MTQKPAHNKAIQSHPSHKQTNIQRIRTQPPGIGRMSRLCVSSVCNFPSMIIRARIIITSFVSARITWRSITVRPSVRLFVRPFFMCSDTCCSSGSTIHLQTIRIASATCVRPRSDLMPAVWAFVRSERSCLLRIQLRACDAFSMSMRYAHLCAALRCQSHTDERTVV